MACHDYLEVLPLATPITVGLHKVTVPGPQELEPEEEKKEEDSKVRRDYHQSFAQRGFGAEKGRLGRHVCRTKLARNIFFEARIFRPESCRTKVSRIFRFFVPNFAPNFAPNFPRII